MKKLITLFALSALSASVLAEGETPNPPAPVFSPYAMTEAQQTMIAEQQQAMAQAFEAQRQFAEQQQKAMAEAFETRRQLAEQQQKAMQEAFEAQQKRITEQAQAFGTAPFATPDIAAFPMPFPEPPTLAGPFASTDPVMALPQPPSYTELRTLSPEDRRAAMKKYAEQRRAAADKYHAEMRKQFDAERELALRNAYTYM